MNIHELDSYRLSDAIKFHDRLNHRLWSNDEHLHPQVRDKLLEISQDFQEFLGVPDLDVKDITISGSNAAYNYTNHSDIDLHLVIDLPTADSSEVYRELFDAKKYQYNDQHNIKIGGYSVELYVQNPNQEHHSQGIYSLLRNSWISVPKRKQAKIDDISTRSKYQDLAARINDAITSSDFDCMTRLMAKIKLMRQSGLEQQGEFGSDNLAFKMLRANGLIEKLITAKTAARDQQLSLQERMRAAPAPVRYGFAEDVTSNHNGVSPSTKMFLETENDNEQTVYDFIAYAAQHLDIEKMPHIELHTDPDWSARERSFGRYSPETHTLEVNLANRHIMDILRTVAHELTHCKQHLSQPLPDHAGNTGSAWENQANAVAGAIMRDYAQSNPEKFGDHALGESSGYIPTAAQARDPRFIMALSGDVRPGQTGREANKMRLVTDAQGRPQLLQASGRVSLAESIAEEFELFEEQDLFEINMGGKNLRKEAAKTGAMAGMEFEMIVPSMNSDDSDNMPEADYDTDRRCRSIQDAADFFHDGDYNSRRDIANMRESMQQDFIEWTDEKITKDWDNDGEDYLSDWIVNNVDESEWNPDDKTGDERNDDINKFVSEIWDDPNNDYYQQAYTEYREENAETYDESDWLDAQDLDLMSNVENAYEITWPNWTMNDGSGEIDATQVAEEFGQALGREVRVNTQYHQSGARPGLKNQFYIVEPDGSLQGDNDGDKGLEFVSPPMPIDELLKDLNAVGKWAGRMGVYTNSSTGLHINISVPGYSKDNLDYVKLALLLGDEYVLDQFGRSSNTYTKSAMGKVRARVRDNPKVAQQLLANMKNQLGVLASKAIHSGDTEKFTSINTKDGHIEFRSPGGDWLGELAAGESKIENTLLRFVVAMSAALNPEAYREEYLKKLYKLLNVDNKQDPLAIFARYAAGQLPAAELKSFVRQVQADRKEKKSGEEIVGAPEAGVSATAPHPEGRGRPNDPNGRYAIVRRSDPRNYSHRRNSAAPDYLFRFSLPGEFTQSQIRAVRMAWAARNNVDPEDYMFVDTTQFAAPTGRLPVGPPGITTPTGSTTTGEWGVWVPSLDRYVTIGNAGPRRFMRHADAQAWIQDYNTRAPNNNLELNIRLIDPPAAASNTPSPIPGIIDIEPNVEQNFVPGSTADIQQRRAAGGEFTGSWQVMIDGEEVYQFSGIGNDQGAANQHGRFWILSQIRQGALQPAEGAEIEVLPIMS